MNSTFWKCWNVTNPMYGWKQKLFIWMVLHKQKVYDGDYGWRNNTCSYWETWVCFSKQIIKIETFLNFLTVRIMMFFDWIILYKCQAFDWDFDGTNQAYSCWEVSLHISIKIIINSAFHKFLTISILMQGTKSIFRYWNTSPWVKTIRERPWLETKTCSSAEKWVLKSWKFNTNRSFWHYLNVHITERYDAADNISTKLYVFRVWIF